MNKLLALLLISPLLLIPISLAASTGNASTTYAVYNIFYTKTASLYSAYNSSKTTGTLYVSSNLNIYITSTKLSNGKFNDTLKVVGHVYRNVNLNISGLLISANSNSSVNYTISFASNYSINNLASLFTMLNMLNLTLSRSGNVTYDNITITYNVKLIEVGNTKVVFNNKTQEGYLYSLFGNVVAKTIKSSAYYSNSTVVGKAIFLNNGLLYNASISGSGKTSVNIMRFSMKGDSNEMLVIKLTSTNLSSSSSDSEPHTITTSSSATKSSQAVSSINNAYQGSSSQTEKLPLFAILLSAGIIGTLTTAILLVRKLI